MSSPRAAAEIAVICLRPEISAILRQERSLAPALEPLRETIRAVRVAGVLSNRDGVPIPDLERIASLPPEARARLAQTGRVAGEALAGAWALGAPLADLLAPAVARVRGVSLLRHEPVIHRRMLQAEPRTLFVFDDNMQRTGMEGQAAEMRGEPNAVGIPTKRAPSMSPDAFFTDADLLQAIEVFVQEFGRLETHLRAGGQIVVPEADIGGGRAQLAQRAPAIRDLLAKAMDALDREAASVPDARRATEILAEAKVRADTSAARPVPDRPRVYAGIGSRETPPSELVRLEAVGALLQRQSWTLRSGAAEGADSAFERGADRAAREDGTTARKEIYIPWRGFQNRSERELGVILAANLPKAREASDLAKRFHPAWERMGRGPQALHSRNSHQLLGRDLNAPADVVICWTEGGAIKGGTGQALRIAQDLGVPILNLGDPRWRDATPEEIAAEAARVADAGRQTTSAQTAPSHGRDVLRFTGADRIGSNMYAAPVHWGDAITPEREGPATLSPTWSPKPSCPPSAKICSANSSAPQPQPSATASPGQRPLKSAPER